MYERFRMSQTMDSAVNIYIYILKTTTEKKKRTK